MKSGSVKYDKINGPEDLISLGTSYQTAQVLFESVRLGLFKALGDKTVSTKTLSERLKLSGSAVARLLRVLHAINLLEQNGSRYKNTPLSKKYLCKGGRNYLGDFFIHIASLQDQWSRLKVSLKSGGMIQPDRSRLAGYREQLKKFLVAMHALGRIKCRAIKAKIPVTQYRNMLDVGGGMGTYTVSFAQENRDLKATLFDLKPVLPHARSYIKSEGMQNRISVQAGRCLADPLPQGPFDLVFISNLLHIYDKQDCKKIVAQAVEALTKKGTLLVHDYIFGCGDGNAVALFDLTMLVGTPAGKCHAKKDIAGWMKSAGISKIKSADISAGTSIMWGRKI